MFLLCSSVQTTGQVIEEADGTKSGAVSEGMSRAAFQDHRYGGEEQYHEELGRLRWPDGFAWDANIAFTLRGEPSNARRAGVIP